MATYSTILASRIQWTEKPGRPQTMGHKASDTVERLTLKECMGFECITLNFLYVVFFLSKLERENFYHQIHTSSKGPIKTLWTLGSFAFGVSSSIKIKLETIFYKCIG